MILNLILDFKGQMSQDNDFETKSEFSRGQSKIDDMEILKQNIVKCIEVMKIP